MKPFEKHNFLFLNQDIFAEKELYTGILAATLDCVTSFLKQVFFLWKSISLRCIYLNTAYPLELIPFFGIYDVIIYCAYNGKCSTYLHTEHPSHDSKDQIQYKTIC